MPKKDRDRYHNTGMWSPMRPTLAFFDDVAIGVAIVEMSEEVLLRYVGGKYIRETEYQANARKYRDSYSWTTTKDLPSGRLRVAASSPERVQWSLDWQEKGTTTLDVSLPRIAKEILAAIPTVTAQVQEAARQAEIRRLERQAAEERRKREEDRWRVEQSIKQSREQLGQVIERWADRMAVERFFDDLSQAVDRLPQAEREEMAKRLGLAREFMGSVDGLDFFRGWQTPREIHAPIFDHDMEPDGPADSD